MQSRRFVQELLGIRAIPSVLRNPRISPMSCRRQVAARLTVAEGAEVLPPRGIRWSAGIGFMPGQRS